MKKITQEFHDLYKKQFGDIATPYDVINSMMEMLPDIIFSDPNLKWLDSGAGRGYFSIVLFERLFEGLRSTIPDDGEREEHIIKSMITMIEINDEYWEGLYAIFGEYANVVQGDYLTHFEEHTFDVIIGNPPYNSNGLKKVPTNQTENKKEDGTTMWIPFVKHSYNLLKQDGYLCYIIPSIWMKPDKANMNIFFTKMMNIIKLRCFNNTETNKIFKGYAQTPTCMLLAKKESATDIIGLYDNCHDTFIDYRIYEHVPIPVYGASIIQKLYKYTNLYGPMMKYVKKTNMPPKGIKISAEMSNEFKHMNIRSCILVNDQPQLVINYSNEPLVYSGVEKLVCPHKMYGFPYYDKEGKYGISNRDNYVIIKEDDVCDLLHLQHFMQTKFAIFLFECTKYRMKYLEKYIFELIPNICACINFPPLGSSEKDIMNYFQLSTKEQNYIESFTKKNYEFKYKID